MDNAYYARSVRGRQVSRSEMVLSLLFVVAILAYLAISVARGENQPFSIGQPPTARPASATPTATFGLRIKPATLEGTWKTTFPVTFYDQIDCSGTKVTTGTQLFHVTWEITAVPGFANVVDVEMTITGTPSIRYYVGGCGGVPVVEIAGVTRETATTETLPLMRATVSGQAITLSEPLLGLKVWGSFVTDQTQMRLTYNHWPCFGGCPGNVTSGKVTLTNAILLNRQR